MACLSNNELNAIIQSTNELMKKMDSLSLAEHFNFSSDRIPVYVKTLYEGYNGFSDRLVDGSFDVLIDRKIKFCHMPVVSATETFENPLLLLCDSTEPDKESIAKMVERTENGLITYSLILFPDTFFQLNAGEKLSYIPICDCVKEHTGSTPMSLKYEDFSESSYYMKKYLQCLNYSIRLNMAKYCVDEMVKHIKNIHLLPSESGDVFTRLVYLEQKQAAVKQLYTLLELAGKINDLLKQWEGVLNNVRNEYDNRIRSIVFRDKVADASPVAIRLDLKYNSNVGDIKRFAEYARNNQHIDTICMRKAVDLANNTLERLSNNTTTLSFIGTFSSGKTTFINSLLGMKHMLPTSARHNTAILTQINNSDKPCDYYKIDYCDRIEWDIISPVTFDPSSCTNPFSSKARVMRISRKNNSYIILLKNMDPPYDLHCKHISGARELCVAENDVVYPGASLIRINKDPKTWQLCSMNELLYIEEILKSDVAMNSQINGQAVDKKYLLDLINQLKKFSEIKGNRATEKRVRAEELAAKLNKSITSIEPIVFSCNMKERENKEVLLDSDNAWTLLCGNPDEEESIALTEQACCYMAANKLNLYFKNDFLKYSTLIDTPGFGSITEKHDNITERYIRDEANHLIVMVAIYMHTDDMKFNDLINRIAELYDTYNKNKDPDNVRFMLNCFTNDMPFAECERRAKKIKESIIKRGFKKENIFACNLRNAIAKGITNEVIAGCKTYEEFKTICLEQIIIEGYRQKYFAIKSDWSRFFESTGNELSKRKHRTEKDLVGNANMFRKKELNLKEISAIMPPDLDAFVAKIEREFWDIYDTFRTGFTTTRKGIFVPHRKNKIVEIYDLFFENAGTTKFAMWKSDEDEFCEKIRTCAAKLEFYNEQDDILSEFPEQTNRNLIVMTHQGIRNLLMEANDETHFWNKGKQTSYYMNKLRKIIDEDLARTKANIYDFYGALISGFFMYKKHIEDRLLDEIDRLDDKDKLNAELHALNNAKKELEDLVRRFNKLNFDIEERKNEWNKA